MPRPVKWTPRIAAMYANREIAEALDCFPEDMLSKEEKEKREQDRERRIQAEAYGWVTPRKREGWMKMIDQYQELIKDRWNVERIGLVKMAGSVHISLWKLSIDNLTTYNMVYNHHADGINTRVITQVDEEVMQKLSKMFYI